MDFHLTDTEQMLIDAAAGFAARRLRPDERASEKLGAPTDAVRRGWDECGLALLATPDPELEVSRPARAAALASIAHGDVAAAFALWQPALVAAAAGRLGATAGDGEPPSAVVLVRELDDARRAHACLPLCGGRRILALDRTGAWAVADVEAEPTSSLGLHASNPSAVSGVSFATHGQADADVAAAVRADLRLSAAALLVGVARAARDYVAGYLPERVAFGKPLSQHQGLAFLFADMVMAVEGAELLVAHAAWALDRGDPAPAPGAWLEAREAALKVTDLGVQLLGGHGYMDDHPVEKWMRDARALALLLGAEDEALHDAAVVVDLGAA